MSTSYGTITITNETEAKKAARYFLHSGGGSYVIAGNSQSFNPSDESTYGFNVRSGTNEIQLRYNNKVLSEWRGGDGTQNSNLVFYDTTNAASTQLALKKLMELTSAGLNFYKKGNDSTAAASLTTNGLEIKEGSITLGAEDQTTHRHPFEVNSNGELYAENATISGDIYAAYIEAKTGDIGGWKVTDHIDYEMVKSIGQSISTYNQTEQFTGLVSNFSSMVSPEFTPVKIRISFSGSLNGLNIDDDTIYNYEISELDTDYIIDYSNLDVGKVKVTFDGSNYIIYITKILNDNITLAIENFYYNVRNNTGALYYTSYIPGTLANSIILSGNGVFSLYPIAGSDTRKIWKIAVGQNFGVDDTGCLYASNANISGYINADSGSIGGWNINNKGLYYDNTKPGASSNTLILSPTGVSSDNPIGGAGIATWKIAVGTTFGVTAYGKLYCNSADITGEITATSGYIGTEANGFTIDSYGFYSGSKTSATSGYITLSNTDFNRDINGVPRSLRFAIGSKFGVSADGILYAHQAVLSGITITGYVTEEDAETIAADEVKKYIKIDGDGIRIAKSVGSATTYNYIDSYGMKLYYNTKLSAQFSSTGLTIYNSSGNGSPIELAHFLSSGAVIKSSTSDKYISLSSNALSFYNTNALCGSLKFSSYAASTSEGNYLDISTNYNNSYAADIKASTNTNTSRISVGVSAPGNYGVDLDMYCTPNNLDNNYNILSLYDNISSTTSQSLLDITANGDVKLCGHHEHIGYTTEFNTTTALTLTTSFANTGAYISLYKGVYVIEAQITVSQTSSDTVISMRIANTTDSVTYGKSTVAIGGSITNLTTVAIVSIDDISSSTRSSTYYVQVKKTQSTSSTVKISAAGLKAVRIA